MDDADYAEGDAEVDNGEKKEQPAAASEGKQEGSKVEVNGVAHQKDGDQVMNGTKSKDNKAEDKPNASKPE